MNFRTTAILAVVLVGVGVFVFVATRNNTDDSTAAPGSTDSTTADSKGRKLFDIAADKLDHLTIHPASGPDIQMTKSGFQWKLVQPIDWPADSSTAGEIVSAIIDLRSRGGIELNPSNLASAGLDHPRFVIDAAGDGKSLHLEIGNRAALGNDLYVKAGDSKQADLVPSGTLGTRLAAGTDKLLQSLRDKQLFSASRTNIQHLELDHKAAHLAVEKTGDKSGDKWKVVQPIAVSAEASEVNSLIDAVTGITASQFSTESAAQDAGAKLDDPRLTVRLATSTGAPAHSAPAGAAPADTTILIGQPVDVEEQKAWVKITSPDRAVVVAQATLSKSTFDKLKSASVLTVRDREVMRLDPESVSSFTVAISRPPTTRPSTRPAELGPPAPSTQPNELREFSIERYKAPPPPTTVPATNPAVATTQPTSKPAMATTQPATHPAVAATQPATLPAPAKWTFISGDHANADEGQVDELLGALNPLRTEKFIEPGTWKGNTYTLTIHGSSAKATEAAPQYVLTLIETDTRVIGQYNDLNFEVDKSLIEKLNGDFKTKKVSQPAPANPSRRLPFPGHPPFGDGQ